ncbi:flavodoxin [Acinetobacter pittii]|uniref:flavodoxin family protein n=1 Tax=Acinetobacter pittii TaxID=48296 RepID=UPI001CD64135|nr:flavodoxin [Acinetobacter pittii]
MTILKWGFLLIGILLGTAIIVLWVVTLIERNQAQQLKDKIPYSQDTSNRSHDIVIYFSRSGNTALAARHVAKRLDATLIALKAPAYELGLNGLSHALKDANSLKKQPKNLPLIIPSSIDLQGYDTVWLGSPVWLYSPAPPIWSFIENNRFDGQHVVLFNTFNSHFKDEYIAVFKAKVMAKGAISFEHRHLLRGRMTQQITPDQMLKSIDKEWFDNTQ